MISKTKSGSTQNPSDNILI